MKTKTYGTSNTHKVPPHQVLDGIDDDMATSDVPELDMSLKNKVTTALVTSAINADDML